MTGVPIRTIRFYIGEGLLPRAEDRSDRGPGYSERHRTRLELIKAYKARHIRLDGLRGLAAMDDGEVLILLQQATDHDPANSWKQDLSESRASFGELAESPAEFMLGALRDYDEDSQELALEQNPSVEPLERRLRDDAQSAESPASAPRAVPSPGQAPGIWKRMRDLASSGRTPSTAPPAPPVQTADVKSGGDPNVSEEVKPATALELTSAMMARQGRIAQGATPPLQAHDSARDQIPSYPHDPIDPNYPGTIPQGDSWSRIPLAPGVELHVRQDAQTRERRLLDELIALARRFRRR